MFEEIRRGFLCCNGHKRRDYITQKVNQQRKNENKTKKRGVLSLIFFAGDAAAFDIDDLAVYVDDDAKTHQP